ncbi:MAG: excinuclease ABC subunit UvrB [Ureaplasma sp.]|nr:excinuclease ABC subunit UvrB [Ureaplasma sp.]
MQDKIFNLHKQYEPCGDQINAIKSLTEKYLSGEKNQVLLGATGTGKTFTFANIINNLQKKTLILVHNKTLATQLYLEIKDMFPNNHVEYFVSYFDYYQPEAYLPSTDSYIEKDSRVNAEIEMMRLSTLTSLFNYDDVIVIASVAAIYASVPPESFEKYILSLEVNQKISMKEIFSGLIKLNYQRNQLDLSPKNFRAKGDVIEVAFGYTTKNFLRISVFDDVIESLELVDSITHKKIQNYQRFNITAADEYITDNDKLDIALQRIRDELKERVKYFNRENRLLEAQRIEQRTNYDLEAIKEFGFCAGIENYSAHLELRSVESTPFTIFDYFNNKNDWLLIVDESHITLPQIRGMYNTDRSRKNTLVDYGFRLPSALANRPLQYDEFLSKTNKILFVSATPNEWEVEYSNNNIVEQIVRPTGLLDPEIFVRPIKYQIDDLMLELERQKKNDERTFITVMTIRMAEELTHYLQQKGVKCAYLHNELKTLERSKIIANLRRGLYDVIIGINLLREGLDVPEVSLVVIFDADKPGFFRSEKSLIQIIGRAARNANGRVIMYADEMTDAMKKSIDETNRRRSLQLKYNLEHNIVPKTIIKPIQTTFIHIDTEIQKTYSKEKDFDKVIADLNKKMLEAAKERNYELAAEYRDAILEIKAKNCKK